ncbi:MAG: HEPN domain-containing protein [Nitrososphaerota archaeon]
MSIFQKFAKKYFDESLRDLERAKRAFMIEDYPQAVFYAQQSLEKGVKAMLEVVRDYLARRGIIGG